MFFICFIKAIKFNTTVEPISDSLGYVGIIVPQEKAKLFIQENARILCEVNNNEAFHGALMSLGNGNYFINLNKERRKKWNIELHQEVSISLRKDDSKYGLPVSEEFLELLRQDPAGERMFHQLTPGKQRSLIYIIGKPKTSNKLLEKALVVLNYVKKAQGKIDFKELNEAFKNANARS